MLSRIRVLQTIREGKSRLDIKDVVFDVEYAVKPSGAGRRAEIMIYSKGRARIVLYPDAVPFSVRHELCHMKLFKMGIPLTNTNNDLELFPKEEDYLRMVLIVEWYINELQRRVFHEYYAVDETGAPRPPPLTGLPKLPEREFTQKQVRLLAETAKRAGHAIY